MFNCLVGIRIHSYLKIAYDIVGDFRFDFNPLIIVKSLLKKLSGWIVCNAIAGILNRSITPDDGDIAHCPHQR